MPATDNLYLFIVEYLDNTFPCPDDSNHDELRGRIKDSLNRFVNLYFDLKTFPDGQPVQVGGAGGSTAHVDIMGTKLYTGTMKQAFKDRNKEVVDAIYLRTQGYRNEDLPGVQDISAYPHAKALKSQGHLFYGLVTLDNEDEAGQRTEMEALVKRLFYRLPWEHDTITGVFRWKALRISPSASATLGLLTALGNGANGGDG